MQIQTPKGGETLANKVQRLAGSHNALVTQTQQASASAKLVIDTLLTLLEKEIPDFENKYEDAKLIMRIENLVEARLNSHSVSDLENYNSFGKALDALRKEAKEDGRALLYDQTLRKLENLIKEEKAKGNAPDLDIPASKITNAKQLEIVKR